MALLQSQDIDVVNSEGEVLTEQFLAKLEVHKKQVTEFPLGIVWRWVLGANDSSDQLKLITQALPCSLAHVDANPILHEEHTRGIFVAELPLC